MCIFSHPVHNVMRTRIFGRLTGSGTQFIVYSMSLSSDTDVAMILPLPVGSHDERTALRFINLEDYPEFFDDLYSGMHRDSRYPQPQSITTLSIDSPLEVHEVGMYEASFVPTLDAFERLDERFRLPRAVWNQLPQYADYGFAVFQLRVPEPHVGRDDTRMITRPLAGEVDTHPAVPFRDMPETEFHPMAFEFVTRDPNVLFFPTVHVHDGRVESSARFDHHLYFQDERIRPGAWTQEVTYGRFRQRQRFQMSVDFDASPPYAPFALRAEQFMSMARAEGVLDAEQACCLVEVGGELDNADVRVSVRDGGLEVFQ